MIFKLARSITEHRAGIEAALVHDLSNARVESMNTRLRTTTVPGHWRMICIE